MGMIAVIGAGASGLAAAISAARENQNHQIVLLEQKEAAGKKLLVTGNGRCNLSNRRMDLSFFRTECPAFAAKALAQFGTGETLAFFDSIGVWTKNRGDFIYPRSDQAAAVRDLLLLEAVRRRVEIWTGWKTETIRPVGHRFQLTLQQTLPGRLSPHAREKKLSADRVILCCGGCAGSVHGSDGSGYALAKALGHSLVPVVPALVQLKARGNPLRTAGGVRTEASVSAIVDGSREAEDTGELQITDYGISGIPVFQISRYLSRALYEKKRPVVKIDFLPGISAKVFEKKCENWLKQNPGMTISDCLRSIFPLKLGHALLKEAGILPDATAGSLPLGWMGKLSGVCKGLRLAISGTKGFEAAQVCAGGVATEEVTPCTFESRLVKGLYFAGELLDVDGVCGGYNLQWAWTSGCLAGKAAAGSLGKQ